MGTTITLDASHFNDAMRELSRISGKDFADVIRHEAVSVLKRAALWEKIANIQDIKKAVQAKFRYGWGEEGRTWRVLISPNNDAIWVMDLISGKKYPVTSQKAVRTKLPDSAWANYSALASDRAFLQSGEERKRIGARGLARQSWVQIADAIGVDIESVPPGGSAQSALARRAIAVNGRSYLNGRAIQEAAQDAFLLTLVNESPIVIKRDGAGRMQRAIDARTTAFNIALRKGVFQNVKARAQRYPGIFVSAN